ncbi:MULTISPECIES: hypothetical protein [Streptomyces]|uniref:Uncharacterized protein n=1 Tax=Streptomyces alboflavus TaxID=67267 RepID=A0A1Z1WGP1_9ACTN|nr:hypothetical protein [Streptomyces alboflavus]ARX85558.1 hypothetical protein SMD44_05022 [Streptomyces alboflavus]
MNPTDVDLDERATRIYADYLAHLSSCPYCQRTDYCTVGDRVRRAWKAAQGAAARAHRK